MSVKVYAFPLTKEESQQPQKTGFGLILNNKDRLVDASCINTDVFGLNNYDKGRNLVVYENTVYEIFKDYCDISNNTRYFMLKPLLTGCEQVK